MLVSGVVHSPNLFKRARRAVVQVRPCKSDVGQLGCIQQPRVVGGLARAHIKRLLIGTLLPAVAIGTAILQSNRLTEFVNIALEERLASLLVRSQIVATQSPAIRPRRKVEYVEGEVGKCAIVVGFRAPKILLRSWPALCGNVRVASVPLERFCPPQVLDEPVIHNVAAKTIGLQIPG